MDCKFAIGVNVLTEQDSPLLNSATYGLMALCGRKLYR